MKKFISVLSAILMLLVLCACKDNTPTLVGMWKGTHSITESEIPGDGSYDLRLTFYDSIEGEEDHYSPTGEFGNRGVQFDYTAEGDTLTIYQGAWEIVYNYAITTENGTDILTVTNTDGDTYTYEKTSDSTPGLRSW